MTYQDIVSATQTDKSLIKLRELIYRRFNINESESRDTYIVYKTHFKYRQGLQVNDDGVIYYKNRFLVPEVLRECAISNWT